MKRIWTAMVCLGALAVLSVPSAAAGVPEKAPLPTAAQLQKAVGPAFVTVSCLGRAGDHVPGQYGLLGPESWRIAPAEDTAAGCAAVTLTFLCEAYAEAFGTDTRTPHTPAPGQADPAVTLFYDPGKGIWEAAADGVWIEAQCRGEHGGGGWEAAPAPNLQAVTKLAAPQEVPTLPEPSFTGGTPASLTLTGIGLLAAAGAAAYLGRRRKDPGD